MRLHRDSPDRAARPLRARRPTALRIALRAISIALLVLVIAVLGAVLAIIAGPTDFGLVRERVAGLIRNAIGPEYSVSVGRAVIDVDPVLGLVARVDDINVRDNSNEVVAKIPTTRFAIDPFSLLAFRADVRQVELSDPEISLVRGVTGGLYLGTAATTRAAADTPAAAAGDAAVADVANGDGGFPDLMGALFLLDRGLEPQLANAVRADFQRFALINGTLNLFDSGGGRRFGSIDLNVGIDPASSELSATLASSGFSGRWTATFERSIDPLSRGHTVSAVVSQLTIADIFPTLGDDESLLAADIPLYGRANVRFAEDGTVEDATARLDFGAGIIRFGEERETVLLDEATVKAHWDVPNKSLVLDPSAFYFGETRGVITGHITPQGDPAQRRYVFQFESPGAVLAPRDSGEPPMIAQRIFVSGNADMTARVINVENAAIVTDTAAVAATGTLGLDGPTPSVAMAATFSPMPVAALKQMWVPLIAPGARRWFLQHVTGGELLSGKFEAAIPAGVLWTRKRPRLPDEALRLDMTFDKASFTSFGDLPPVSNAAGNIVVSGSTVGIDLNAGVVKVPSGIVTVENGAFAVPNTSKKPADGIIALRLSGDARALGEIADAEPLRALQRRDVSPSDLSGTGTADVSVHLPIRDGVTEADVDWKVVINTKDLASSKPIEGRKISNADVTITVTPSEVAIYGKGKLDGVGADVSMSFPLGASDSGGGDRRVRLLIDDEARKRLGVGLDNVIGGTISALVSDAPGGAGQHYDLDLRRARVVLPGVGWTKGVGVPAKLTFDMKPEGDGFTIANLVFEGDGFGFSGSAKLDSSYGLQSADIDRMSLRAGDAVSLRLTRSKSGYAITARGDIFDLRGMMAHVRDHNDQAGGFPDIAFDAQIGKLIGFNQEEIDNVSLAMVSVGGETQKISFSGALAGDPVNLDYAVTPNGTTLTGAAADAGRLMRFTDLYTRVAGGSIRIDGEAGRTGPVIGTITFGPFDLLNEPAMQRIAVGRAGEASSGGDFNPGRVSFERMVAHFRKADRVITIEDALLAGPSVGATFSGRYDLSAAKISITGTYLPAYAINNLFGRIPLLGIALGGGMREGLIGVTFKVDGPIAQPQVFFNPLSAVAPGIFRKIFEFQRPTQ